MAIQSRHTKSHDHSNAPQQKSVLGKKQENEKNEVCSEFFFFVSFSSMQSSFCMKLSFRQVCRKSFLCASTSSSLEQKNENDFEEKTKKSKILS